MPETIQNTVKPIPVQSNFVALLLSLSLSTKKAINPPIQRRKIGNNHQAADVLLVEGGDTV